MEVEKWVVCVVRFGIMLDENLEEVKVVVRVVKFGVVNN